MTNTPITSMADSSREFSESKKEKYKRRWNHPCRFWRGIFLLISTLGWIWVTVLLEDLFGDPYGFAGFISGLITVIFNAVYFIAAMNPQDERIY